MKERPEYYEGENKSVPEDKDRYYKAALTTPKHRHLILLMSGLVLMGDEERHCLVPGLRREQWDGWQAKIDRCNLSDMKMGRVMGPELNPHHQQSFLDAYNVKSSKILSKS